MLRRFWEVVERTLPEQIRRGVDIERRAQARVISAIALVTVGLAVISAPFDALTQPLSPLVDVCIALFAVSLIALQRWTGAVTLTASVLVFALAFLGVGFGVLIPEPGDPNLAWMVVMGLTPALSRSLVFTGGVTLGVIALAFAIATSRPVVPSVMEFGEVFPLIAASWFTMYSVFHAHRRAHVEHLAALKEQHEIEALVDAETRRLVEEAVETAEFLTRVSHELRTPLNGVLGIADLLAQEELAPDTHAELARIQSAGRSVLRAFDTLLLLARTTATGADAVAECDVPGTLDASVHRVTHAAGVAVDQIALELDPDAPRVARLRRGVLATTLEQILGSLLEAGARALRVAASWDERRLSLSIAYSPPATPGDVVGTAPDVAIQIAAELLVSSGGTFHIERAEGEEVIRLALSSSATTSADGPGPRGAAHSPPTAMAR